MVINIFPQIDLIKFKTGIDVKLRENFGSYIILFL